jgi:ATP-dependent RNA helicase DeaD
LKYSFTDLGLRPELVQAVEDLGFEHPTPIQEQTIPALIEKPVDLIAFANTGTGKTAAFGLPLLHHMTEGSKSPTVLILSPTRELCLQIHSDLKAFSKHMKGIRTTAVYGGSSIKTQMDDLKRGTSVVVGTPGRTLDLIKRSKLNLSQVNTVVLDEADEMLSMGFKEDLEEILSATPDQKTTWMFSATLPPAAVTLSKRYMTNPMRIEASSVEETNDSVSHGYFMVRSKDRFEALKRVVDIIPDLYGIIFCRTRRETQEIADKLIADGYNAEAIHGDLSQNQRDMVMKRFREKTLRILVATDVAARGIDVDELTHVINYNLPDEEEVYIHRSGRTGRAGNTGFCYSIVHTREGNRIKSLQKRIGKEIEPLLVPTGWEVCNEKLFQYIQKVEFAQVNDDRLEAFMTQVNEQLKGLSREEVIRRFVSLAFNRFLEHYENAPDINARAEKGREDRKKGGKNRGETESFQRFFINRGAKDRLNAKKLMSFINRHVDDSSMDIGRIDISPAFSFFEVDKNYADVVVKELNGANLDGDRVVVEKAEPAPRGGRDRKRKGKGGGNRGRSGKRRR